MATTPKEERAPALRMRGGAFRPTSCLAPRLDSRNRADKEGYARLTPQPLI